MQTQTIIASTAALPLHLRRDSELLRQPVSTRSLWGDKQWALDNETIGSRHISINWEVSLPSGLSLLHPKHARMLDWMRRLVWSLMVVPGDGAKPLKTSSLVHVARGLKTLAWWMVGSGRSLPHELTPEALELFWDELPRLMAEEVADEIEDEAEAQEADAEGFSISRSAAYDRVRPIFSIWQQRYALAQAGIKVMAAQPWPGRSPLDLARELQTRAEGEILPLPDEVSIPVMNAAARLMGIPADDVIRLQTVYLSAHAQGAARWHDRPGDSPAARNKVAVAAIRSFEFSVLEGEVTPWRRPIEPIVGPSGRVDHVSALRGLVVDIRTAATIVLQSTTGIRISELCGLKAGVDADTGLPSCVTVETSVSGLYDIFIVRSRLSKTEATPREVDWVLGMRLRGSDEMPLPIRAILVLNQLLAPYRELSGIDDLLLSFTAHGIPKSAESLGRITSERLRIALKDWLPEYVDLSGLPDTSANPMREGDLIRYRESKGRCLTTHQWRKTMAHFVFAADNRLIPALSLQMHHVSRAMTERNYLGRNHIIAGAYNSAQRQKTASMLFEMAEGRRAVAGRMGDHLNGTIDEIRSLIEGVPVSKAWSRVLRFIDTYAVRIWFSPHGKCLPLSPTEMRCHVLAGTTSWRNQEPNYRTREPTVCAGCDCFIVDGAHASFWERRFLENWISWRRAEATGETRGFTVIRGRAAQARAILTKLGVDVQALETSRMGEA